MIAIQTKFLPSTNTKGSRIKAFTTARPWSVTIPYDYSVNHELPHFRAVQVFVEKYKLDWDLSNMRFGAVDKGYVFCFQNSIVSDSI